MGFHNTYTYQELFAAYMDCRKSKRNKRSAIAFEVRFEESLARLLSEINSGGYQVGQSTVFVVTKPKPREIWAALFRDRIVHHLIYNDIGPQFERRFIEDTFSCIKGRGTLAAANRLEQLYRRATNNHATPIWCLQFDIRNFFGSLDKYILWRLLDPHIQRDVTRDLLYKVVFNDPTLTPIIRPGTRFTSVPPHKSLWNAAKDVGLPIGNLTSQFFSNVYLDVLDQFVKHKLRACSYVRYVDDAVILHRDKSVLAGWMKDIGTFLRRDLHLDLQPDKCHIHPAAQGINFVGYIVKPWRRYARRSTVDSAKAAAWRVQKCPTEDGVASVNSYLGILRQTASWKIRERICRIASIPTLVTDQNNEKLVYL